LLIVEAYDILSNPELKEKYDLELRKANDPNYTEAVIFDHPFAVSRGHAGFRH
jgi:curved DNA-binding protein CbpA